MNAPPAPAPRKARLLPLAALVLWLVSLGLPGFLPETQAESWHGGTIFLAGTFMGAFVGGWAVYANYFFLFAVVRLLAGKRPWKAVVAMVLLAATLPMFEGVIHDGSMKLEIVSWGWGVVVWLYAMGVVVVATALQGRETPKTVPWALAAGLVALIAGLAFVHHRQWLNANEEERAVQIAPGMAFTVGELCGIPLTWPPETPPSLDNFVILDVDKRLRSGEPILILPPIPNYQEGSFAWKTLGGPGVDVKVRVPAKPDLPTLRAKRTEEGALVQLIDPDGKTIRYEQRLRSVRGHERVPARFCPRAGDSDGRDTRPGYVAAISRVLGQPAGKKAVGPIAPEAARTRCDIGAKDIEGVKDLRSLDGREAELGSEWSQFRKRAGFCSERYIALGRVGADPPSPRAPIVPDVILLERSTLRQLAWYRTLPECGDQAKCKAPPLDAIKGIRIEENTATIETSAGEFTAARLVPWNK